MSVLVALFDGEEQLTPWGPDTRRIGFLDKPVTRMVLWYGNDKLEIPTYFAAHTEIWLGKPPDPTEVRTEDLFGADLEENELIGLVCDQIDRRVEMAIEECQAIARDIIQLVRERS